MRAGHKSRADGSKKQEGRGGKRVMGDSNGKRAPRKRCTIEIDVRYVDEVTGEISPLEPIEQIRDDLTIRWPAQEDHPRDSP